MANDTFLKGGKKDNRRRYKGGGPRPDLTEIKRSEAAERQEAWSKLSPVQQLEALDRRLGSGVGAVKQRAKLALAIEQMKNSSSSSHVAATQSEHGAEERVNARSKNRREQAKRSSR